MEKTCKVCLVTKPLSEFYKHPRMADGHLGKCKECQKAASTKARNAALEVTKKWKAEDSRRMKCHSAVARALRKGLIEPAPCAVCGSEKSVAHHEDYDKPLDVIWLCQAHHKQLHAKRK